MKKVIGIDIDSVIAESDKIFTKELERITGRKLIREINSSFKYEEAFDIDDLTMKQFWTEFTQKKGWIKLPLMKGAKETINALKNQGYYIVIVTARPPIIEEQTKKWLKINNIPYDELFFTNYKNKFEYVAHLKNLNYFLEDHPDFALQLANNGITVLLFDWPWNQYVNHKNIIRVKNWFEAQNILFKSNLNK